MLCQCAAQPNVNKRVPPKPSIVLESLVERHPEAGKQRPTCASCAEIAFTSVIGTVFTAELIA